MEEYIDIKYFLLKHNKENRKKEETFNDIEEYIKENGFFTGDDVKKVFELGEKGEENNIMSDNDIINKFRDEEIDEFINYISTVGFFTKKDIDNVYNIAIENGSNEKLNGEILRDFFITHFRQYLIYNYDKI